jgi:hypothetical protein
MGNEFVHFCPRCGKPVIEQEADEEGVINVKCTNTKCMFSQKGTGLTLHHPVYGCDHAPGDSWALSWIE